MTRKRDRYQSAFDGGIPGTRSSVYDISIALYLLERFVRERRLLQERVTLTAQRGESWSVLYLLEVGRQALNTSVGPAVQIYRRLQENAEAARTMAKAFPLDGEWHEMAGALERTLNDQAIVSRSEVTRARRIIARRAKTKETSGDAA